MNREHATCQPETQLMTPLGHSFYLPPIITFIHDPRPFPYLVSAATAFNSASKSNRESSGSLMTVVIILAHVVINKNMPFLKASKELPQDYALQKMVDEHTISSRCLSTRW